MTPERWQQITGVFHAALLRAGADRPPFLQHACGADESLRAEVEAMLAAHDRAGEPGSLPAVAVSEQMVRLEIQGTQPAGPGGPIESVIGVIMRDYDGFGQFTQVSNVKGSITPWVPDRVGGGTYDVAADCTAIVHLQRAPGIVVEERLVIVDAGREIRSAAMLPAPGMVTGVARRVHRD
jgi:hypothetical protein